MKHLDEVFDYFNSMPTAAIKNIKPDEAFQEKKKKQYMISIMKSH